MLKIVNHLTYLKEVGNGFNVENLSLWLETPLHASNGGDSQYPVLLPLLLVLPFQLEALNIERFASQTTLKSTIILQLEQPPATTIKIAQTGWW